MLGEYRECLDLPLSIQGARGALRGQGDVKPAADSICSGEIASLLEGQGERVKTQEGARAQPRCSY